MSNPSCASFFTTKNEAPPQTGEASSPVPALSFFMNAKEPIRRFCRKEPISPAVFHE